MTESDDLKTLIFDVYRGTTHDGPGMRTTVFVKGCPLSCRWCHNPEGMTYQNEITYTRRKCIGCRSCSQQAGRNIVIIKDDKPVLAVKPSEIPKMCAEFCPTGALKPEAKLYSVDEAYKTAIRDKDYFDEFGGGVTISGGEPTSHPEFTEALLKKLKENKIHTALDTSGLVEWKILERLLPYVDVILYDLKVADPILHKKLTGVDNRLIKENLKKIVDYKKKTAGFSIWIRTPLIPGDTATETNISEIGQFLVDAGAGEIERWELCAFNNTCLRKYEMCGKEWFYKDVPLMSDDEADAMKEIASRYIGQEKVVRSGFTSKPKSSC